MTRRLTWGDDTLRLTFAWSDDESPRIVEITGTGARAVSTHPVPFFEIVTVGSGHSPATSRLSHSQLGTRLRYVSHETSTIETSTAGTTEALTLVARSGSLEATARLEITAGIAAVRSTVTVRNTGDAAAAAPAVTLRSVASWSSDLGAPVDDWDLVRGESDWLAEGRWSTAPLRAALPALRSDLTGHDPRGAVSARSHGSWSTGGELPVAALVAAGATGTAWAWQIEHNGAWRWEVGEELGGGSLTLSGPTDDDHAWLRILRPGESFTTVPVTVALGTDLDAAAAALTAHRRAHRRPHPDNAAMPVVFNDYMNTLNGDPTTERLLPLVDAAAAIGSEIFCIDAGWYDDSVIPGAWWGSVGEWLPSEARFPAGLGEVIDRIRSHGMVPGLWLEPEVIGVRSPMAERLPAEAFLQRHGERVEEHERYHLDLRHPAVIEHLDATVDRLVADFGIGFFKFDYNINPGVGTDLAADSAGDGLLRHNRAHLAWLDRLLDRHPELVIESCSSGAMRTDFAVLSRLQLQSTSDQQDYTLYPPIAAASPLSMLPEQAASWAYPQPDMTEEQIAFCLVTGLLGRFYVSGYLNRMTDAQRALVTEAVAVAQGLRGEIAAGTPSWPLGLPGWGDASVSLALHTEATTLVSVWQRDVPGQDAATPANPDGTTIELALPALAGVEVDVEIVFPTALPAWPSSWDAEAGILTVHPTGPAPVARTFRLTRTA